MATVLTAFHTLSLTLLVLGLLSVLTAPALADFPSGWSRSCVLTVQHGQVAADLINFPVLVSYNATSNNETNLPDEMIQAGNANAAQANGGDIRFTLDAGGTIPLHYEIVTFLRNENLSNAKAEIWVKLPAVSSSADTSFYVWYKASSAQTTPAATDAHWGSQGTWDDGFKGVWHLPDGNNLSARDATANSIDGTIYNATASSGKIYGDGGFNGSSAYVYLNNPAVLQPSLVTVSGWFKTGSDGIILRKRLYGYWVRISSGLLQFALYDDRYNQAVAQSVASYTNGAWHHFAGVYDGTSIKLYVDGSEVSSGNALGTNLTYYETGGIAIGRDGDSSNSYFNGDIDEVRISAVARPAGWVTTEYRNQNAPQTFLVRGTAASAGSPKQFSGGTAIVGVNSITH